MKNTVKDIIGVFGHYGNKNLGDEAIIAAVIHNIQSYQPGSKIIGFSINPIDTEKRHNIQSFPIRRLKKQNQISENGMYQQKGTFIHSELGEKLSIMQQLKQTLKDRLDRMPILKVLIKMPFGLFEGMVSTGKEIQFLFNTYGILKNTDKLLVCGSNQFLDNFGGFSGFPYTLLKWTVLSRLAKTKVYFLSLGAGPLKSNISMFMIKRCIDLCEYISFRDHGSKMLVGQQANPKAGVFPDLAFSEDYLDLVDRHQKSKKRLRIGINPMPVFDKRYWPVSDDRKYRLYVENFAELYVALKKNGFEPFFYNTQNSDLLVIEDVIALISCQTRTSVVDREIVEVCRSDTLDELMNVIASADILVPTRFHGIILAYKADKPVVGICYGPKSKELVESVARKGSAFDVETFKAKQILNETIRIAGNYDDETKKIRTTREKYEKLLDVQYGKIF
ncbi:polysaccharide pyruvyl transferase family protein [uncultured Desulfosarcina sp.]|uniref:polysaccharide pyruvyl transferase family protein n=1 Tax=uncultured Desulfosarcina sp. TaxID=218289 RepID=UPI0029C6CD8C|nr:polysaccharide pyruvyl transferase family protein [uncultured Desulfosarcina sp.]